MTETSRSNNLPARAPSRKYAALTLFLLPAISVELLTGNTSLANFLNPAVFFLLSMTYGGALLLVRETVVRWGKGFISVVVLAGAYGMVNEGITSKGFFDPHFYAVVENGLQGFGRWFGINVPWALSISIFHATFSIIVPLVIVSAIFPGSGRWLGNRLYGALLVLFVALMVFSFHVLSPTATHYKYNEGPGPIALILSLIALDILVAWKLPAPHPRRWPVRFPVPALFALGVVYAFAFFISTRILRATGSPIAFVAFYLVLFVALPVWLLLKLPEPSARGKVALAAGLLAPILAVGSRKGAGGAFAAVIVIAVLIIGFVRNPPGTAEPCDALTERKLSSIP